MIDETKYVPIIKSKEDHDAAIMQLSRLIEADRAEDAPI
jgi:hypothetical protein